MSRRNPPPTRLAPSEERSSPEWDEIAAREWITSLYPNEQSPTLVHFSGTCPSCSHRLEHNEPLVGHRGIGLSGIRGRDLEAAVAGVASEVKSRPVVVICNCDSPRCNAGPFGKGCALYVSLHVDWGNGLRVSAGEPIKPGMKRTAEKRQRDAAGELDAVRSQAEKWRNSLSGLIALIALVSAFKGPDSMKGLDFGHLVAVAILLLLAVATSALGSFLGMRAAYGMPRRIWQPATEVDAMSQELRKLDKACSDLHKTIALTYLSLSLFIAAIGTTWFR